MCAVIAAYYFTLTTAEPVIVRQMRMMMKMRSCRLDLRLDTDHNDVIIHHH